MKPYYYVYRVGYKFPTIKHHALTSAAKEAERLSNQHPGETFEILECQAVTRTVLAKTFWMDGVTPPPSFQESSGENVQAVPAAAGGSESTQEPSPPLGTSE